MPKVTEKHLKEKRDQILDAAFEVCMEKPVYSIKMKDVIDKMEYSHGLVYRYFSSLEEILFALINRADPNIDESTKVDEIINSVSSPESIVCELLALHFEVVIKNIAGFGKIYYEMTPMLVSDPALYKQFKEKVNAASNSDYLKLRAYEYTRQQIEEGYFSPRQPLEAIFSFINVCIDGIERDMILSQCYLDKALPISIELNPDHLLTSLCQSVVCLLGGNENKLY